LLIVPGQAGRDDEGTGHRFVELFDQVPLAALTGGADQPGPGQLFQMVVHLLARQAYVPGDRSRRIRLPQGLEHCPADRVIEGIDAAGIDHCGGARLH
jgi:hypothetical protein